LFRGVDAVFIVPWFLLLAVALGIGLWRGARFGTARGVKAAAVTTAIGIVTLVVLYVALIVAYYASGGH
jgi:hypothetical protein